jgi:PAS domain S-box-containing protein
MRALLVVHDSLSRTHLSRVLEERGWDVDSLPDTSEALDRVRRSGVDLLVLEDDAHGSARSICGAIRAAPAGHAVYLLGLASAGDIEALRDLAVAGFDDVLGAPFLSHEAEARVALAEARTAFAEREWSDAVSRFGAGSWEIQRRLRVQQAFLEGLFESAPEGIVILDQAGRVVRANQEFTRVFGYAQDEIVGQPINDLIVPETLRTEGAQLDGGVRRGERVMVDTVRRHRDGRLIDVSVAGNTIEVNGPVGAFGIYRDISERRRQEAALRESEARYRALFDQSPVGLLLCDRDLRITHCNGQLATLIGSPYEEIVGADLRTFRNLRLLPGLRAALRGEPAYYEGPYRSQTGRQLHVTVQYAPMRDETGVVIGGIGVIEDISGRVLAERQLRAQAAEMERVNAALRERTLDLETAIKARSRLYSAINHELRTPISAVLLYQELLIAESLGALNEEQLRALEHSHTATRHLLELVRDILDLSKIEAGKVRVEPVEVSLSSLLDELKASMDPLTDRYGSSLHVEIEEGLERVTADPQRLRQVLMNFVSNAAKFGRRKPITIRARFGPAGPVIEVRDLGIGIPEEDLEQIFDDFVQLGLEQEQGTGLGLAISRRLAELMGARLEVESEVGVGSTFRIVLPPESVPASLATG